MIGDSVDWTNVHELYTWSSSFENWQRLAEILRLYVSDHKPILMFAYMSFYIFFQSFAIPGSTTLSLIGGAVFGLVPTLFLACGSTAIGATNCYFISKALGTDVVDKYLHERVVSWRRQVNAHQHDLLYYLLFLRVTPFLPNWFINIGSPHVGVPWPMFTLATFLGAFPLALLPVTFGTAMLEMKSWADVSLVQKEWPYINVQFATIVVSVAVSLLVVIFARVTLRKRFQEQV